MLLTGRQVHRQSDGLTECRQQDRATTTYCCLISYLLVSMIDLLLYIILYNASVMLSFSVVVWRDKCCIQLSLHVFFAAILDRSFVLAARNSRDVLISAPLCIQTAPGIMRIIRQKTRPPKTSGIRVVYGHPHTTPAFVCSVMLWRTASVPVTLRQAA